MTTINDIFVAISKETAIRARKEGNDKLVIEPDDEDVVSGHIENGIREVAVKVGIIKYDSGEVPIPEIIPQELMRAVQCYALTEWYDIIGEHKEGVYWRAKYDEEVKKYRFNPSKPSTTTRPYRMIV